GGYYHAPPGWITREMHVQWARLHVRLLDPKTGELLREHLAVLRGGRRVREEDRPKRTPKSTLYYLGEMARVGRNAGALAEGLRQRFGDEEVTRRLQGMRALVKKYGAAAVDDASAALLELGVYDYRALRRYLE